MPCADSPRATSSTFARDARYQPVDRDRVVSPALRAYAMMATSADTGAVRDVEGVERLVNAARLLDSERLTS